MSAAVSIFDCRPTARAMLMPSAKPPSNSDHPAAKILVVEDNETNRFVLTHKLETFGYRVACAKDGFEAIEMLQNSEFDLVFMDVSMPGIDGLETTRRIRKLSSDYSKIPIVGLSAHTHDEVRSDCIASGMDEFLTKPASNERILEKLQILL